MSVLANKAWQIKGLPQTALMFDSSTLGSNLGMKTEIGLEFRFQYGEQDSNVCREATFDFPPAFLLDFVLCEMPDKTSWNFSFAISI